MKSFLNKIWKKLGIVGNDKKSNNEKLEYIDYIKTMFSFSAPAYCINRIGQDIENVSEYDLTTEYKVDDLDGHLSKRFIRIDKSYFANYFNFIKKGNATSYISYLNEEDIKLDLIPNDISTLLKKIIYLKDITDKKSLKNFFEFAYAEILTSRILNYFNCETVYNDIIISDNLYILSLDFIKSNQKFFTTNDIINRMAFLGDNSLSYNIEALNNQIPKFCEYLSREYDLTKIKYDLKTINQNIVYSWLIRYIFLGDLDFSGRNFGLLYDHNIGELKTAPNYDFEYCLKKSPLANQSAFAGRLAKNNLSYLQKNYSDVYNRFINKLKNLIKKNKFTHLSPLDNILQSINIDENLLNYYKNLIIENINTILAYDNSLSFNIANQFKELK